MIKQLVCGLLVIGAGCAGLDGAEPTPTPNGASPETGGAVLEDPAAPAVPGDPALSAAAIPPPATAGGTWTKLPNVPSFQAGFPLLLTDGTVIISEVSTGRWRRLTPSITGSYLNGTWSQIAQMPSGYTPLYFGAGVLPDGRVMIEGGEYINNSAVWTTKGAVYNPVTNTWANVNPPAGWTTIGDATGIVLADGTYMQSNCCTTQSALLNPTTMTWTATGTGKQGSSNDEESWTRLPDGTILTVDCNNTVNLQASEIYTPSTGKWTLGPNTANKSCDINSDGSGSHENGPQLLMYNGNVLAVGGTGKNDIYNPTTKTWTAAPNSPVVGGQQLDSADGPGVLLPNGNVLLAMSPGVFNNGTHMIEWNGSTFTEVAKPPGAPNNSSFNQNFMLLPTGEVLLTDFTSDIEMYRPTVTTPVSAAVPVINSLSTTALVHGGTFSLTAQRMNGLSGAVAYGDDGSGETNYPIVRITMTSNSHVFYCRTFNHSTRAIGTGVVGTTSFAVPSTIETGSARIELVANGIPSPAVSVTVM
ncbi:MAG TPA: hypothetical protein VF469_32795 [Kofleriaceae bacterium]